MIGFFELHRPQRWSTTDKDASITVSGLTVSGGGGSGGGSFVSARCGQALAPNQKLYFEVTCTATSDNFGFGVMNANGSLTSYAGGDSNGVSYYSGGTFSYGGSQSGTVTVAATGNVVSLAVDGINKLFWACVNGGNWNGNVIGSQNPATATGGMPCALAFALPVYITYTSNSATGETLVLNAGSSAFSYTPPVGFRSPNSCSTN